MQKVEGHERAEVPDVRVGVHRGAAGVDPNLPLLQGEEGVQGAGEGVVELQ